MDLKLRDGVIRDGNVIYPVYWGSAQWSITGVCASYIVQFHDSYEDFNKWFMTAFPCDELYFNTVVMNSEYREKTTKNGPEPAKKGLVNFRNLHYFEYLLGRIRIWDLNDLNELRKKKDLYIRKVNAEASKELLERLDEANSINNTYKGEGL